MPLQIPSPPRVRNVSLFITHPYFYGFQLLPDRFPNAIAAVAEDCTGQVQPDVINSFWAPGSLWRGALAAKKAIL
jgi:hypothetical protein